MIQLSQDNLKQYTRLDEPRLFSFQVFLAKAIFSLEFIFITAHKPQI